jgi:hypothetical protein
VAAGRALQAPPQHHNLPAYLGCCPSLACHVYGRAAYACTLREALAPGGAHWQLLGSWEARVAACLQVVAAATHLLRRGVVAR